MGLPVANLKVITFKTCNIEHVKFPLRPIHLLCMLQFHTVPHKYSVPSVGTDAQITCNKSNNRVPKCDVIENEICIGNSMICSDIWHKYHE